VSERAPERGLLIRAGETMTDLGHFDLAHRTLTLALVHAPNENDLRDRTIVALSKLRLLTGDVPGGLYLLEGRGATRPQAAPSDRTAQHFAEYAAHLAEVLYRGGDLLRAERVYENCIDLVTGLWRLPDTEATCRAGLAKVREEIGDWKSRDDQLKHATETLSRGANFSVVAALYAESLGRLLRWDAPQLLAPHIPAFRQGFANVPPTVPVLAYRLMFDTLHEWVRWRQGATHIDLKAVQATLELLSTHPYWSARELGPLVVTAQLLRKIGRDDIALRLLDELMQRLELARTLLDDDRMRVAFESAVRPFFDFVVDLHLARGDSGVLDALAVHEANRGRATTMPDASTGGIITAQGGNDPSDACHSRRAHLSAALRTERSDVGHRTADFLSLVLERGGCTGPLGPTAGTYQRRSLPELDLRGLQASLGKTTAILVFRLRGALPGAWVITRDAIVWRASAPSQVVDERLLELRTAIRAPDEVPHPQLVRVAQLAYRGLLAPLAHDLVGKTRLVVIPDGRLFEVPVEVFVAPDGPDARRFLIETHEVSYHVSLAGLRQRWRPDANASPSRVLLLGDPIVEAGSAALAAGLAPLHGVRQELDRLRQIVGAENSIVRVGRAATREALKSSLGTVSVLHLATHGVVNERDPWGSYFCSRRPILP
jgi:hypothetical protein